ncbi:MAG: hypothetical protein A3E78_03745 [Alphaproteobacteria bacterium RIFCSPHIGHO2_12_FULL_63_12]|nr:MAG: hypothetical protein A3E78_03745 [Alphaproteobacteria bacterium RIFCSPHIGHO2_12_FULL_63_12]
MNTPPPSLLRQGLEAAENGDFARADAIARALLTQNPNDAHGFQIAGFSAYRQGDRQKALESFWRANRAAPGQPALLYWLGVLFRERGDFIQAERAFREAVQNAPLYGDALCSLGETLFHLNRKEEAQSIFEKAIEAEPSSSAVLARAARFFDVIHDAAQSRALAERAVLLNPADEIARIALLEIHLRAGRFGEVLSGVAPLLKDGADCNQRSQARLYHLAATAQDKLGDYAAAFQSYKASNRLRSLLDRDIAAKAPTPLQTDNLERIIRWTKSSEPASWERPAGLQGPAPVFLLGFVRSGTTWLDQILSSHPLAAVMEEEDLLVDSWRDLLITDEGLARLPSLPIDDINRQRAAYWARADKALGGMKGKPVIVDKLPLNTANLPLIWRLFPDAKIIFALRDPRDAVFSAFQQYFQVNAGMAHFLDLTAAATFYDRVMTIGASMREKAPLALYEIRYETLVADFDGEIRKLLAFLGLDWDDSVQNYQETAKRRAVRTPSAKQVIEKPFSTSIGKWRRYRDGMAPALPILAPWVEKFGYDPD